MFYRQTESEQLTRTEMETARRAFRGKLVRLRFSPQFIVNNADDLLATAHSEYVRAVKQGTEIEDPVGWTIHCAWRRTQNLLQTESERPRTVSVEKVAELVDDGERGAEELAVEEDRRRKIREAVSRLDEEQRKVIALTFFEEMSVREAARHLGCTASAVQHKRERALANLRRFLPVHGSDELAVDVGMACWLALAGEQAGFHLPAGFEAVLDRAGHGATGLWGRAQELVRRFTVGGGEETATAVAAGGGTRAIGVCATSAALVCLAGAGTGLVGPGIGPFGSDGGHRHEAHLRTTAKAKASPKQAARGRTAPTPNLARTGRIGHEATPSTTAESGAPIPVESSKQETRLSNQTQAAGPKPSPTQAHASARHEEAVQVEEETSGIARAAAEAPTGSRAPEALASDQGSPEAATVVHVGQTESQTGTIRHTSGGGTAAEEFDFEK